jgi:hypothetical protein
VRQSLGEPTGSTTNPDGSGTFSYAMGPVATVTFKADGTVETCSTPRTATEQMDLVKTLVEAKQTLTNLGLTDSEIQLVDGSTVIVDIPGISKTYHFDDKGNITTAYTFLFKAITTEAAKANETQASLEAFLEERALTPATKSAITALAKSATGLKAGQSATYPSPDVLNGTVIVTYKNNGAAKPIVIVDKVTFQGPQPKNIS